MTAPGTVADDPLDRWRTGFEDMFALVASRFVLADSRYRARMYLLGLLVLDNLADPRVLW